MKREHFVKMGKTSSLRKTEAARKNAQAPRRGARTACLKCGSTDKVLRREDKVRRVCRRCHFIADGVIPGNLASLWAKWSSKWRTYTIARRPLAAWSLPELRDQQRKYLGNSADDQGALDAALIELSGKTQTGKLTLSQVTALGQTGHQEGKAFP